MHGICVKDLSIKRSHWNAKAIWNALNVALKFSQFHKNRTSPKNCINSQKIPKQKTNLTIFDCISLNSFLSHIRFCFIYNVKKYLWHFSVWYEKRFLTIRWLAWPPSKFSFMKRMCGEKKKKGLDEQIS